jgi:hypothetical protein
VSTDGDFMRVAQGVIAQATEAVAKLDTSEHDHLLDAAAIFRAAALAIETERTLSDCVLWGASQQHALTAACEALAQFEIACEIIERKDYP